MRHRDLLLALGLSVAAAFGACAQGERLKVRVCLNETPRFPYRLEDPTTGKGSAGGLDFLFLTLWAKTANLDLAVSLAPGRRCLADLRSGAQDVITALSYLPEREDSAVYPRRQDGSLDDALAIRNSSYSWYVPATLAKPAAAAPPVLPAHAIVGVQSSNSVAGALRELGYRVDEGSRTVDAALAQIQRRRVSAAVLQTEAADFVLKHSPALSAQVSRLQPPFQKRLYFLVFAPEFARHNAARLDELWRAAAHVRDDPGFRQATEAAFKQGESER